MLLGYAAASHHTAMLGACTGAGALSRRLYAFSAGSHCGVWPPCTAHMLPCMLMRSFMPVLSSPIPLL